MGESRAYKPGFDSFLFTSEVVRKLEKRLAHRLLHSDEQAPANDDMPGVVSLASTTTAKTTSEQFIGCVSTEHVPA